MSRTNDSAVSAVEIAFPSWKYLCHLWPVRAVERVDFSKVQPTPSPDMHVLVALRSSSALNSFAMFEDDVLEQWPDANMKVITDLPFGVRTSGLRASREDGSASTGS